MLVLASNSPRRKELLALGDWAFTVNPVDIDESPLLGEHPREYVERLAMSKAHRTADISSAGDIVIAADTTVADGDSILGKPADNREAEQMLRRLRGRTHQVFTAVAVEIISGNEILCELCETAVPMRPYLDEELLGYIATGDPLDKAGAYAIQHAGFNPVTALSGCFANVMGLPLCHLVRGLAKIAVHSTTDIPQACQTKLGYECPIFADVLRGAY
jgi:MAF protein